MLMMCAHSTGICKPGLGTVWTFGTRWISETVLEVKDKASTKMQTVLEGATS